VVVGRRGRRDASVEVVSYGSECDWDAFESTGRWAPRDGCARATRRATRAHLRETRDAGHLESVGTCGLGLWRFVSAGVARGTDLVYLSATVRCHGEPAHFRPPGVVDPDTGCSIAGPRRADLDCFGEHPAQQDIRIRDQRVGDTLDRAVDSVRCGLPAEGR
jgi:hypothetical protein